MTYEREIAGIGVFVVAGLLVWKGATAEALYLILPTVGFFVGEKNGQRTVTKEPEKAST